jgi:hypothetical protein
MPDPEPPEELPDPEPPEELPDPEPPEELPDPEPPEELPDPETSRSRIKILIKVLVSRKSIEFSMIGVRDVLSQNVL